MNTKDRNIKAKKKVEYEDMFENNDKGKDTENDENETKINTMDRKIYKSQEESWIGRHIWE